MARISPSEVVRLLEEESDWNDSDEEGPHDGTHDSGDKVEDTDGPEHCHLDYIEQYEVSVCIVII